MEQTTNSFIKGLRMDYNPMSTPNETLTDALNASVITMNDNEVSLQNDMGNRKLDGVELPEGYTPVGIKEYGGVVYIASYNPLTGKGLVGSFPSPKQGNFIDHTTKTEIDYTSFSTIESQYGWKELISTSYIKLLSTENIHPGDKFQFIVVGEDNNFEIEYGVLNNLNEFIPIDIDISTLQYLTYTEDTSNRTYSIAENIDRNQADLNTYTGNIVGPLAAKISLSTILEYNPNVHVYWDNGTIKVSITSDQSVPNDTQFYYWADDSDYSHYTHVPITDASISISLTLPSTAKILHCAILTCLDNNQEIYVNRFQNNYSVDLIQQSSYEIIEWNYSYINGTALIHFKLANYSTDPSTDNIIIIYSDGQEDKQITFPLNPNQTYSDEIVLNANLFIPMELKTQNGQRIGTRWILTTDLFNGINVKDLGNPTEADKSLIENRTTKTTHIEDPLDIPTKSYSGNYITKENTTSYSYREDYQLNLSVSDSQFPSGLEFKNGSCTINSIANDFITRKVEITENNISSRWTYTTPTVSAGDTAVEWLFKSLDEVIKDSLNFAYQKGFRLLIYNGDSNKSSFRFWTKNPSTVYENQINIVSVGVRDSYDTSIKVKIDSGTENFMNFSDYYPNYLKFGNYANLYQNLNLLGNDLFTFLINDIQDNGNEKQHYPTKIVYTNPNIEYSGRKYSRLWTKIKSGNNSSIGFFPNILVYQKTFGYELITINQEPFPYCISSAMTEISGAKIIDESKLPSNYTDTLSYKINYEKNYSLTGCYTPTFRITTTFSHSVTMNRGDEQDGDAANLLEKVLITPEGNILSCLGFNVDSVNHSAPLYSYYRLQLNSTVNFNVDENYVLTIDSFNIPDNQTNPVLTKDVIYYNQTGDSDNWTSLINYPYPEGDPHGKYLFNRGEPYYELNGATDLYEMDYSDPNYLIIT